MPTHFPRREADVCVIGAGLAGLIAADELLAAGLRVDVFEAQAGVGGRVKDTRRPGDVAVELGANWFSGQQPLIAEQIRRFGLETVATHDDGLHLFAWNGRTRTFRGAIPPLGPLKLVDISQAIARFDRIAARLHGQAPWGSEALQRYDRLSFGQWIDAHLYTRAGREFFYLVSEMVFGVEPHLVSFLYVLYYASRSVSLTSLISVGQGHQELRFRDGPARLCDRIAERIGPAHLHLETPVRAVRLAGDGVEVDTSRLTGRYRAVLCAVPPPAARQIAFAPALPPARGRLLQALPMGRVVKVQAIYERPFWLEQGLSGQSMCDGYPLTYTIDNSPADRRCGVLAAFVCSSRAERFLDAHTDRTAVAAQAIDRLFGGRFPAPREVLVEDWAANPWIGGSYGAYFPPGVMTTLGRALHDQQPPLYWCGAEYGQVHPCQMEGALESGLRSARLIKTAFAHE